MNTLGLKAAKFAKHREVLKAKRKELKGKGKGRKPNAARLIRHFQGKTEWNCLNVAFWKVITLRGYKLPFGLIIHFTSTREVAKNTMI